MIKLLYTIRKGDFSNHLMSNKQHNSVERQRLIQKYRQKLIKTRSHLIFDQSPVGSLIRWVCKLSIAGIVLVICVIGLNLIHEYHDSAHWTRITGPKTADIPTDILYASANEKADKLKYLKYQGLMWDADKHQLKKSASASNYDQLQKAYGKLKNKDDVQTTYDQIKEAWSFHQDYNDLLTSKGSVKMSTTPEEVSQLINDHFPQITPYLVDSTQFQFANDEQAKMNKLASDQAVMNAIVSNFAKQFKASGKRTLKSQIYATTSAKKTFNQESKKLQMKWQLQKQFARIYNASGSLLEKHDVLMDALSAYQEDQSQMNSFNRFLSLWNKEQDKLNNQTVDLPDFTGKSKSDVDSWADKNNITVRYRYQSSSSVSDNTVLSQMPSASQYNKIIKGSSMIVYLARNSGNTSSSADHDNSSSKDDNDTLNMNANNPTADRESRKESDSSSSSSSSDSNSDQNTSQNGNSTAQSNADNSNQNNNQ